MRWLRVVWVPLIKGVAGRLQHQRSIDIGPHEAEPYVRAAEPVSVDQLRHVYASQGEAQLLVGTGPRHFHHGSAFVRYPLGGIAQHWLVVDRIESDRDLVLNPLCSYAHLALAVGNEPCGIEALESVAQLASGRADVQVVRAGATQVVSDFSTVSGGMPGPLSATVKASSAKVI